MGALRRHASAIAMLVVSLLAPAQWAGATTVLCVAGPDHIEVESLGAGCCAPRTAGGRELLDDSGECPGCTDIPLGNALDRNPERRLSPDDTPAAGGAVPPDGSLSSADLRPAPSAGPQATSAGRAASSPLRC